MLSGSDGGRNCRAWFPSDQRWVTAVEAEHGSEGSLNVRFGPKATELLRRREMTRWAKTGCEQSQQSPRLFDHLVGAQKKRLGYLETKSLCGGDIDAQIEFGRLLDRQVGWLCAPQYLVDEVGGAP